MRNYQHLHIMNFDLYPDIVELRDRTRSFIKEQVIALENDGRQNSHSPCEELRRELVERARAAGLLTPHVSRRMGGLGLSLGANLRVICEEARFSAIFTKLGFHPAFGLSVTLPRLIGLQYSGSLSDLRNGTLQSFIEQQVNKILARKKLFKRMFRKSFTAV